MTEIEAFYVEYDRPRWVKELKLFLEDTIVDFLGEGGVDDDVSDRVTQAAMAVVCAHYGHFVENDHCGMSHHRHCLWCGEMFSDIPRGTYHGAPFNSDKPCG